ncbi:MAG: ABC transporter substrate-binding protein [Hyphomicrobiales bacterium]|nr:ABC transporter substrate-binding protein [Hyphomicrobiales bacterium]
MHGKTARKFSRREFAALLFGAGLAGGVRPVLAAVDPAEGYVGKIADEVMSLANSGAKGTALRGRFASVLNRYVNLRGIANFALGPYQKKLPPGDKNEFYTLFNNYAAALFVYYVDDFKGSELQIISTSKQGKFITIVSAIRQNGGGREQVRWRLIPAGGGYRISDINVKGVWLTIATKKRFGDVLNRSKGDFGALFAELREAETW